MDPNFQEKPAFSTPYAHLEFTRMPFGLKNAPATFQRVMDQVLTGLQGVELFVYMDDIVIYAQDLKEHDRKLRALLLHLRDAGLTLQPEKCHFLRREITYLGHIITREGVKPDPRKIEAVKNFPISRTKKNIKQFLGLIGYYRRFIPEFAKISKPLTHLLKENINFKWTEIEQKAVETLRDAICSDPVLQYPDFSKPFLVTTDASNYALGGVLSQGTIGRDLPISFASRVLQNAELNYSTIEKELLAIIFAVRHFRPYIYGRKFTLVTDHRPLVWLYKLKDPVSRLGRWRVELFEYDYNIVYKPGKINCNADALSRNPYNIEEEKDSLPVTLTGGRSLKIANSYRARPSSEQDEESSKNKENDKCVEELLGRIFLSEVCPKTRKDEMKDKTKNDDYSPPGKRVLQQVQTLGNSAGCRSQGPRNQGGRSNHYWCNLWRMRFIDLRCIKRWLGINAGYV